MINIMQDYDDIVCCIGSSLNSRNHTIFSSTDVRYVFLEYSLVLLMNFYAACQLFFPLLSISVNPIFRKVCPTKQHKLNDCYDLKNSEDIWSVNKIKGNIILKNYCIVAFV